MICTRPFIASAKHMARVLNVPDYPFIVVDHPLGSLTPEQVRLRAAHAHEQGLKILMA